MNLDKENIKKLRQLILFTIVILIAFWNYNIIFGWIRFAFGIIFPFLLGGAIAFVLNVPMSFLEEKIFRNRYLKDKKIAKRLARPVCLVLTIAIVIGVVVLVMFVVIPELTTTVISLGKTIRDFIPEAQRFLEDFQKGLKTGEPALDQKNYLIREAADYIRQNLSRGDISLDEIADHLLISKSYLCRLFQKNLGISVQQYIHHTRIEQAKEYLNDFRLKIYEVAELTGFNSSTHFNIVFKKIMRCTPAEYRNGLKQ